MPWWVGFCVVIAISTLALLVLLESYSAIWRGRVIPEPVVNVMKNTIEFFQSLVMVAIGAVLQWMSSEKRKDGD